MRDLNWHMMCGGVKDSGREFNSEDFGVQFKVDPNVLGLGRPRKVSGFSSESMFTQRMVTQTTILAAEDQESSALLLRMAFEAMGLPFRLVIVENGQCAVDYLKGIPPYNDRAQHPLPGMMLLDLQMPRMDGFKVLAWLRESSEFSGLPVVVLSSSPRESDMERAKKLGAREFLVKPLGYWELTVMLKGVAERWLPAEEWV
jgi:CheY-like chemotaxis protein